jgi:hypothetical protein
MRKMTCLLLILVTLNGCMQWSASHLPLDQALSPDPGSKTIRVWLLDQRAIELTKPTVTDSTIAGISTDLRAELVVIPRDSVKSVDVLTSDGGVEGLVFLTVMLGAVVMLATAAGNAGRSVAKGLGCCE